MTAGFKNEAAFTGKVVLITGGTSGIGRATAVAFAEQRANVVVARRREAEGAESVRLVEKAGGNGLFVRTDVSIEREVEAMVARTVEYFGRLDFGFNNAGVSGEMDSGLGIANTNEFFNRIMDANVRGVFFSPIGRFGQSVEVAAAVLYLCSPGAAFITGAALPVDGGVLA
jgi:NAD(P)-dependent dehydrogenase (short-subunit alcohol dehydrogenase family)